MRVSTATVVFLVTACAAAFAAERERSLTVTGTAEVRVAPDICYMNFVVTTEHKSSAAKAYEANNRLMGAVSAAVKSLGIDAKDIQTRNFSITPEYRWVEKTGERVFEGYEVSHTLAVSLRKLDIVSQVLDAAVGAGATQVSNVAFTVENPKKYLGEARLEAIAAARAKAEAMADAAGVRLVKPVTVQEHEPSAYSRYAAQANVQLDQAGWMAGSEAPLAPGELRLSTTVTITYEIR